MLPLQQSYEIKHSILEYLKATFSFKDKRVHEAFYRFVTHPEEGIFKGPYVSLRLPFVKVQKGETIPLEIAPDFQPYDHQFKSFQRLTTRDGSAPQSTLITTGTSSGKTECFLYPVLDYCYQHLDQRGIKVIILYPMNALATDQAKRLAEVIWNDPRLKGKITAGLFIGEGKDKQKYPRDMGETHIIESRDSIVDSPPDILLTNFKMLDYALMRNNFHNLWTYNLADPSLLQFLVLDELHTYDGAQGTDVANLIRRLKLKLDISKGQLCAVGTSATIGSGGDAVDLLTAYAEKVFGEAFLPDSVITEHRVEVDDFFEQADELLEKFIPRQIGLLESRLRGNENYDTYITRQKRLWQMPENLDAVQLGTELKKLQLVKDLLSLTNKGVIRLDILLTKLADLNPDFRRLAEWDALHELSPREEVINSLFSLISEAKIESGKQYPLLYLQIQVWIRELSGVLRELGEQPCFSWRDKVGDRYDPKALPAYYCRECGASGWMGVKDDNKNHFNSDPLQVYEYFFSNHKNIYFINTIDHRHTDEYEPGDLINSHLQVVDLTLNDKATTQSLKIHAVRKNKENRASHICPECNTENTLGIIGTRIATLSSITVSQVLASDLDPRAEKYRKILAFTNSVQDAAHQAGFIEARNYRFTLRTSLQKVINQATGPLPITTLQELFSAHWRSHADSTGQQQEEAYYYRFFPADYHNSVDIDTDYRDVAKKFTPAFKAEFDTRISWEVLSEFGYNAILGRTLEKSGASAVKFDQEKMQAVFPAMRTWLEQNQLAMLQESDFLTFVNGILHRVRTRGGIDHVYLDKFREDSLKLWDLNWMKDNRHFLNKRFHPRSRFPRLLTTHPHNRGVLDSTFTTSNNWYRSYFLKSFSLAPSYHPLVNDFFQQLLEVFAALGLMNRKGTLDNENYAIDPAIVLIENKVAAHTCDTCGSRLFVAGSDEVSVQTKCLDYTCPGTYSKLETDHPNYYQLVYNRNLSPRIYAAEHTGLLERKDREFKEFDFKERPRFNSLNTIVATSTLEMGIDIGTLNSVINNSVPPLTSNYLQRIGRAGRTSGSALVTNFAQNKAHDLFYYEEPKDMMEGDITPPGCFLEAREILFRHFFAYCLDSWSTTDPVNNAIPGRIISLRLMNTDLSNPDFLVNRIISFIKSQEEQLLNRFIDFYQPDLEDTKVLEDLRRYLLEEGFYRRLKNVFVQLQKEYRSIHEKRKEIDRAIQEKKLPVTDEERKELESEKKALWGLKRIIDKRSILEHLTNVGILPNYAFPETGVTLNARIKTFKAKASDNMPSDHQFEIVRTSVSAIKELAPDNSFYSQGFRFNISGINTYDWSDAGVLMKKRFCSNCDHITDSVVANESNCPKCGDSSWSSVKNQHIFVKLNGVKSVDTREKSKLDDSSDDRDSINYRTSNHIRFDPASFQGAWGMKDIPFGIEYYKNVDIMEANLGLSTAVDANKITINQVKDVPYHGFVTCRSCGKSTSKVQKKKKEENEKVNDKFKSHYGYCKHKEKEYQGKTDEVFEEVYLWREMKTEALKVLLPVQEFESESTVKMFRAGLELGLKKYYKGNPQHLSMVEYAEYNSQNSRFDKYLVLYDNIPGGTGYLEKLFDPEAFSEVILKAFDAIRNCGCQFKGKDGCYRCIFTYSNQYIRNELSRSKAESLFRKIVERSGIWEKYNTGLGSLTGGGQIEESELEDRFIRSLKNYVRLQEASGAKWEEFVENGIINYKFRLINGDTSYDYTIRPQYDLGNSEGVRFKTRADFYITLSGIEHNRIPIVDMDLLSAVKSIALYLDGYTYHATKENFRFVNDLLKRVAIAATPDKLSWTLTWSDMEKFDKPENEPDAEKSDELALDKVKYKETIDIYKKTPHWKDQSSGLLDAGNSMKRLIWLLINPLPAYQPEQKTGLLLSLRQSKFCVPSVDADKMEAAIFSDTFTILPTSRATNLASGDFYIFPEIPELPDFVHIRLGVKLKDLKILSNITVKDQSDTLDKPSWEFFWQLFNLVQSYGQFNIVSAKEVLYDQAEEESDNPFECLQYFDEDLHPVLRMLIEHRVPFEQEGSFFIEMNGVHAEAALGFPDKKLFIRPLSDTDKKIFEQAGYTELQPGSFKIEDLL